MLSPEHRLTSPREFEFAVKSGHRAGSSLVVVHQVKGRSDTSCPRIGFVVSKTVGNAVVRNRVKRRLRHLCRSRVDGLETGTLTVVRATSGAAEATYGELDEALGRCLARVRQRVGSEA